MKLIRSFAPLLVVATWVTFPPQHLAAQYGRAASGWPSASGWENDRIRVRTEHRSAPIIGLVLDDGRVALPGFN